MIALLGAFSSQAMIPGIQPEDIHIAESRETDLFLKKGVISGGDRNVSYVMVKNIRRSLEKNKRGYERIVIDLQGNRNGDPARIIRPPFYFVGIKNAEKKIEFTIFGKPRLGFNAEKIVRQTKKLRKKSIIEDLELLPLVEKDRWGFSLKLKKVAGVRVFHLSNPVRIILDIKTR